MEELIMAKKPEHGLRVTPGNFQIRGTVQGTNNKNFYTEKDLNGGNKLRAVSFGVKYDVLRDNGVVHKEFGKTMYSVVIQGFTRNDVYFSKKNEEGKTEVKKVVWAQRLDFASKNPDWRVIGTNIGLEKDEDGNNIKQYLTEYDAAKYVKENLKDNESVYVRGNLDFRHFPSKDGSVQRRTNYSATQISLCSDVDFEDDQFKAMHDWEQEIIYTDIEKEEGVDGKATGRFILSGYVVSFNSIEPVSFVVVDSSLASN